MGNASDPFLRRLRWISFAVLFLAVAWALLPWLERYLIGLTAEPRAVTARGELAADERNTIEVFRTASPSVVFISTQGHVLGLDVLTRELVEVPRQGSGSGFVWDELGHIVTNNHVIDQASEASVRLNDGRTYRATLIGTSPDHDLAVLRISIPFDRPPPVPIGSSEDLLVGQKVFAIGNPFGFDSTLTSGLVSALDRSLQADDGTIIEHLIQTDAAINRGSSGGPLLDSAGRLIGINTAIYSPSGAYAGIGFAVPVDTVNRVVPQLIAKGKYIRPVLGINVDEDVNRAIVAQLQIKGVVILGVQPGSSAEAAGLRGATWTSDGQFVPGDVILAVNGKPVDSVSSLLGRLDEQQIGDAVTLTIWRAGRELAIDVLLGAGS